MCKLIINELRFCDPHSELGGNASLQKQEQVWHCWSELEKWSVKKSLVLNAYWIQKSLQAQLR